MDPDPGGPKTWGSGSGSGSGSPTLLVTLDVFLLYSFARHLFVCVEVVPAVDAMAGDISEPEEEEGSSATSSSASIELDRAVPRHTLLGMPESSVGKMTTFDL
jgi:hypothetical protein